MSQFTIQFGIVGLLTLMMVPAQADDLTQAAARTQLSARTAVRMPAVLSAARLQVACGACAAVSGCVSCAADVRMLWLAAALATQRPTSVLCVFVCSEAPIYTVALGTTTLELGIKQVLGRFYEAIFQRFSPLIISKISLDTAYTQVC